jgi:hypothetical protein
LQEINNKSVAGRRGSVVEHTLGKGGVESSILSGGTIIFLLFKIQDK